MTYREVITTVLTKGQEHRVTRSSAGGVVGCPSNYFVAGAEAGDTICSNINSPMRCAKCFDSEYQGETIQSFSYIDPKYRGKPFSQPREVPTDLMSQADVSLLYNLENEIPLDEVEDYDCDEIRESIKEAHLKSSELYKRLEAILDGMNMSKTNKELALRYSTLKYFILNLDEADEDELARKLGTIYDVHDYLVNKHREYTTKKVQDAFSKASATKKVQEALSKASAQKSQATAESKDTMEKIETKPFSELMRNAKVTVSAEELKSADSFPLRGLRPVREDNTTTDNKAAGADNRGEKKSMFNIKSLFGEFGKVTNDAVAMTFAGQIAIKRNANEYVRYNPETQTIENQMDLVLKEASDFIYIMPVNVVVAGDIIKSKESFYQITDILENGSLRVVNIKDGSKKTILKETNMFGISFYSKVLSLFNAGTGANQTTTGINPMMLAMMGSDGDNDMLPMMMMMGQGGFGGGATAGGVNPAMMMMLMSDKDGKGDKSSSMKDMLMMQMMMGGQGGFGAPAQPAVQPTTYRPAVQEPQE